MKQKKDFFRSKNDPLHIPPGGPGASPSPPRVYDQMGEQSIQLMLKDFYKLLGSSEIAPMFPQELEQAAAKSALFFIGLLGGPPLYHQTYGPPRMRMRHLPFKITESHRQVWLACFYKVLENSERYRFPDQEIPAFKAFLEGFSGWMVNSEDTAMPS
ncbi:hypothetical protein [Pseudobacteriovorax antillogorgiicola]|uniref:Hemoglobin n=1 Tax=Pseudobacteriovorax antillogorgiicola TaxID=1513793 RepID=A0A1Y6BTU0_9BACT|nr:hypothetical protein [Pseudobacteriovorax antillogorgiicola]TCS52450.1 hemoglobin [Pseudobacteriovorax antillogorgiicola]SMF28502.1 hemoglobin [Pseudobacteriovorax antillogorgiicola]